MDVARVALDTGRQASPPRGLVHIRYFRYYYSIFFLRDA
jgi:hypothetical protein